MRYLLVGLGNIGQKRRALLGDRCVATVDAHNPAADYRSTEECPADRYDAVVLAVPNEAKPALLERSLSLGKHVLIEKPLLLELRAEAERLDRLARARGAVWYTSYNHRFEPLIVRLKECLDAETIGPLYHGRLFYGNGTVANVRGTWREEGLGVVEDLLPHLVDLASYLLGHTGGLVPWVKARHEARCFDHAVAGSDDGRLTFEMTYVAWRNSFSIDLFGARGSLHLNGLRKWGPTELTIRRRVLPSGAPHETVERSEGADVTWERDLEHFEALVKGGGTTMENDWRISEAIRQAAA